MHKNPLTENLGSLKQQNDSPRFPRNCSCNNKCLCIDLNDASKILADLVDHTVHHVYLSELGMSIWVRRVVFFAKRKCSCILAFLVNLAPIALALSTWVGRINVGIYPNGLAYLIGRFVVENRRKKGYRLVPMLRFGLPLIRRINVSYQQLQMTRRRASDNLDIRRVLSIQIVYNFKLFHWFWAAEFSPVFS